jgi:hypothetical protein
MKIFMENVMEFHEIFHKISWKFFMKKSNVFESFHEIPWNPKKFSMDLHGIFHEISWNSMKLRLMKFHGSPWSSMENFMEFHGISWNSMNSTGMVRVL